MVTDTRLVIQGDESKQLLSGSEVSEKVLSIDNSMNIGMSFLFLLFFFLSNFLFADKPASSTSKIDASLAPMSQPEFDTICRACDTISNTVILDLINEDAASSETSYRNSLRRQILDGCASL